MGTRSRATPLVAPGAAPVRVFHTENGFEFWSDYRLPVIVQLRPDYWEVGVEDQAMDGTIRHHKFMTYDLAIQYYLWADARLRPRWWQKIYRWLLVTAYVFGLNPRYRRGNQRKFGTRRKAHFDKWHDV